MLSNSADVQERLFEDVTFLMDRPASSISFSGLEIDGLVADGAIVF